MVRVLCRSSCLRRCGVVSGTIRKLKYSTTARRDECRQVPPSNSPSSASDQISFLELSVCCCCCMWLRACLKHAAERLPRTFTLRGAHSLCDQNMYTARKDRLLCTVRRNVAWKVVVMHPRHHVTNDAAPTPGSGRKRRKVQKEAKAAKYISKNEKKLVVHKYLGKVRCAKYVEC